MFSPKANPKNVLMVIQTGNPVVTGKRQGTNSRSTVLPQCKILELEGVFLYLGRSFDDIFEIHSPPRNSFYGFDPRKLLARICGSIFSLTGFQKYYGFFFIAPTISFKILMVSYNFSLLCRYRRFLLPSISRSLLFDRHITRRALIGNL